MRLGVMSSLATRLFLFSALSIPFGCGNKDRSPNRPPTIDPIQNYTANENTYFTTNISASDPDGDPITLRANSPYNARFSGNKFEWTPGDYQTGRQTVWIGASDGRGGSDNESFVVDVIDDFSDNPIIGSNPIAQATEGRKYAYKVDANDPDTGQTSTLKYALGIKTAVNNGLRINSATGLIEWDNPALGTYSIDVEVEDTTGRKVSQQFDLKVIEPRYTLSGKIVDLDGKPLQNVSVLIKGIGAITTDSSGSYKFGNLLTGDYVVETSDGFTKVYDRKHIIRISQDAMENIQNLKIARVASSSTKYLDRTGIPDFLVFFRHTSGTQTSPKTQRWASLPVPIFLNNNSNSTSAEQAAPGRDIDKNGVNDLVDFARQSINVWEKESGLNLFDEKQAPVGWDDTTLTQYPPGIFLNYPLSTSGGGDLSVLPPANITQIGEIEVSSSLPDDLLKTNILRGLGLSIGLKPTEGHPSYLLLDGPISPTITKPQQDELEALRALYGLLQDTDMSEFEGR